jgi:hypothetical protein
MGSPAFLVNERDIRRMSQARPIARRCSPKFLGKPDKKTFGSANVAELVGVLIPDDIADKLGAARAQPLKGLFNVIDCEHSSEITEGVHRGVPDYF